MFKDLKLYSNIIRYEIFRNIKRHKESLRNDRETFYEVGNCNDKIYKIIAGYPLSLGENL